MTTITKQFTTYAYFDGSRVYSLLDKFKVNSPKQAKQRFLKKYGAVLVGDWLIKVTNYEGEQVLDFPSTEQIELKINKSVNLKPSSAQKKQTRGGKLAQIVLDALYSDGDTPQINGKPAKYLYRDTSGEIHAWAGKGRRPKWFEAYRESGQAISDIKINN